MANPTSGPTRIALKRERRVALPFALQPDAQAQKDLAQALDIAGLRKLSFVGTLDPEGKTDWRLTAHLGATVVQPCVVTLAPVTTRIEADVSRLYLADWQDPTGEEAEMPEDDTAEALPSDLDLTTVMTEALALALPDYPRAEDAALEDAQFAAPGVTPMTDDDAKPLAGLAALRDKMRDDPSGPEGD